ncbi:hypothetical protein [Pseudodesulfovibrio sp.]|uniref:hypothetical protein n=1 Tax=Pseudodesulfovibrio sp. TaxID=2035812 RepID=UPI002613C5E7|nr:hypothetical protein [Pseudodesulfovibrio sp.]MDD3313823.1 hypothetical protein [Pseudodesulfovibrio sp.]
MQRADIERIFEAFFEKYKKTEGDETAWSAYWTELTPAGKFEINLTKCPCGTIFKVFVDNKKVLELNGWDAFFEGMAAFGEAHPGLYDPDVFFADMEAMI